MSAPKCWVLGDATYRDVGGLSACAALLAPPAAPTAPAAVAAGSAESEASAAAHARSCSVRARRAAGVSQCSRDRSEREIHERLKREAVLAAQEAEAAEEDLLETQRMVEMGVLLPDGSAAPPKRKRPTTTRDRRRIVEQNQAARVYEDDGPPKPKRVRPSASGPEYEARMAAKAAAKAERERKEREKEAEKEAKAAAKRAKKHPPKQAAFVAGDVCEVALRLGESYASWCGGGPLVWLGSGWRPPGFRAGCLGRGLRVAGGVWAAACCAAHCLRSTPFCCTKSAYIIVVQSSSSAPERSDFLAAFLR